MNEVFHLFLNDWEALYINGKLKYENHTIRAYEAMSLLKDYGPYELDSYYLEEDFSSEQSMKDESSFQNTFSGSCPEEFEDLEKWLIQNTKNYLDERFDMVKV